MHGFILALQFFTRIPIHINSEFSENNLKKAFFFLPVLGGIIGGVTLCPLYFIPKKYLVAATVISTVVYLALTGGLHIDGVADTADGFFSVRSQKEKILEIMSDSRIGSYGALAIIVVFLFRCVSYMLLAHTTGVLILAGIISRLAGLGVVVFSKPAKETGLGVLFHKAASKKSFFFWLTVVCFLCLFTPEIASFNFINRHITLHTFLYRIRYMLFPFIAFIVTFFIARISYKKIGGTTGDVNGCAVELTETAVLLSAAFILT